MNADVADLEQFARDVAARISSNAWPPGITAGDRTPIFLARAPGRRPAFLAPSLADSELGDTW